ncbi:histidinol-phosphatase [bacterium]|nr:histidinol-phosphatase [bacterium]MBU1651829.1 histidinol-phosphatase [bacterium]MBU1880394.1 histidinol-phosphatase [bacterium]
MITIDLHTHPSPWRCGPGAFHSFVQSALHNGVDILGFCEHGPSILNDPRYRGLEEREIEDYINRVLHLRDEFAGQIQILCGLELDYHPDVLDRYAWMRRELPVDYFMGSVHIIDDWYIDTVDSSGTSIHRNKSLQELYQLYYDTLNEAVNTDLFDVIGHIDYIRRSLSHPPETPPDFSQDIFAELAQRLAIKQVAVEVNTRGWRIEAMQEVHPTLPLRKALARAGVMFTIGSDAHEGKDIGAGIKEAGRLLLLDGIDEVVYFRNFEKHFISL